MYTKYYSTALLSEPAVRVGGDVHIIGNIILYIAINCQFNLKIRENVPIDEKQYGKKSAAKYCVVSAEFYHYCLHN
jgi:hypothetical protein